jgi:DNA-binding protein HU-beta
LHFHGFSYILNQDSSSWQTAARVFDFTSTKGRIGLRPYRVASVGCYMTTTEMVKMLAKRFKISQQEARRHLYNTFATISESLQKGEMVLLRGFGTFGTRESKPRRGYSPFTKRIVSIPSKMHVFFRPSKNLKETVKERRPT